MYNMVGRPATIADGRCRLSRLKHHSRPPTRSLRSSEEPTVRMEREPRTAARDEPVAEKADGTRDAVFFPNQVVAERFRIVRLIGRGGMGEVYEAEDLELHEGVALKAVRLSTARDSRALERFKREINLARKVTHANVCRTFDLYRHRPDPESPEGEDDEVTFLSMELLLGQTLAERLRCCGSMTVAEGLPIVQQMAAALAAAQRAGIVHRDFKSQNVILVEPEDSSGGVRAVVTDFGLARFAAGAAETGQSSLGDFAGSPFYMAPEQVEGGEVTAATDVYALGVVMYEMMTGTLPFAGDSPLEAAVKRLKESPLPPRALVPDLDARWEQVILRCLERDPSRRFSSAAEVARSLAREASPAFGKHANRRWLILGAAATIVLVTAFISMKLVRRPSRVGPVTQPSPQAAVPPASGNTSVPAPAKAPPKPANAAVKSKPAGNPLSAADSTAHALWKQGDLEGARRVYAVALNAARAYGTTDAVAGTLAHLGAVLGEQGTLTSARSTLEQAVGLYRQTRDSAGLAGALADLGRVLADTGDFTGARKDFDESLAVAGGAGDKAAVGQALTAQAGLLLATGDAAGARSKVEEATALLSQANDTSGLARAERELGLVLVAQGELDPARSHLERSLELSRQLGEKPSVGESQLAMAQLAVEEGRASDAEKEAQAAVEEFRRERASDEVVLADAILARALVDQGRTVDAQKAIEEARVLGQHSEVVRLPLIVSEVDAVVRVAGSTAASASSGASAGANTGLQAAVEASSESMKSVIAEAKRRGLLNVELEARLALGEMDMKYGNRRSGLTRLAAVEKAASARGYGLIARQAETARKSRPGS